MLSRGHCDFFLDLLVIVGVEGGGEGCGVTAAADGRSKVALRGIQALRPGPCEWKW